ncbi:MAG: hypothetical protein JSR66_01280 [Proteobacteria bacterium]|nr:hypothetical protein [Pseudomonadota bacterium]
MNIADCRPNPAEAERVAAHARSVLSLVDKDLPTDYYYNSLSLCVIDAVFSIGVRYGGVQAVVRRYCARFHLSQCRGPRDPIPAAEHQESLGDLCNHFEQLGVDQMANSVFANRQRTSIRNGILKAEAVWRFARALRRHQLEHLQDIATTLPDAALEADIRAIPGQGSGISLRYFWMLAGSDELIKPDRMILRFLETALARSVGIAEAQPLLAAAVQDLKPEFPHLTPRALDYKIWEYQRAPKRGESALTVPSGRSEA